MTIVRVLQMLELPHNLELHLPPAPQHSSPQVTVLTLVILRMPELVISPILLQRGPHSISPSDLVPECHSLMSLLVPTVLVQSPLKAEPNARKRVGEVYFGDDPKEQK